MAQALHMRGVKNAGIRLAACAALLCWTYAQCAAQTIVLHPCDVVERWKLEAVQGSSSGSAIEPDRDGVEGAGSLRVRFVPASPGVDRIVVRCGGEWDLSDASRVEFWVKSVAPDCRFEAVLADRASSEVRLRFRPERLLEDIFTPSWRRVSIPVPGGGAEFDWRSVRSFALALDDSLDPSRNQAAEIGIDAVCAVRGRPDPHRPLRFPPEMRPAEDGTFDLMVLERPSFQSSRWGWEKVLGARPDRGKIKAVTYSHPVWKPEGGYNGLPTTYSGLSECDVVAISALDAEAMDRTFQAILADYVEAGGGLLVVGGYESLGKGQVTGSVLDALLPVATTGPWDLKATEERRIRAMGDFPLTPALPAASEVFYVQEVRPREGAEVWLAAGQEPFLSAWRYGRGGVAVLSGTVLGGGENAFWAADGYPEFMNAILDWLSGR